MFYILYGQDDFSLRQAVRKIKADLGNPEMLISNTSNLDGQRLTLNELKNQCHAMPFLSSYRLIIVDGLLQHFEAKQIKSRTGKGARKSHKKLEGWEDMNSCIKQMPDTTVLVLIDGGIKVNNPLLKQLSPLAKVMTFPLLRGEKLKSWIEQRTREEGGSITSQSVNLLTELIGGDLWAMNNEIQKLVLYRQGQAIDEDDVRQMVGYARETSIFPLVDAVLEGKGGIAQGILHHLYQEGEASTYILSMITRQFRLIAQARELEHGLSQQQIKDRLGLAPNYPLNRLLAQAKSYSFNEIKGAYDKLLETDLAIKTGKYNDRLAIELLVAELTGSRV